jgi:hypothetical protein
MTALKLPPHILDELRTSWETGRQARIDEKETADILRGLLSQMLPLAQMMLFDHGVTTRRQSGATWEAAQIGALTALMEAPKIPHRSAIEAHSGPQPAPDIETHGKPPASPPQARYEGIEAIKHMAARGITLIGRYENNAAIAKGKNYPKAFTADMAVIHNLMDGKGDQAGRGKGTKIRRFTFIPQDAGFLCLDIDRGHKDGKDGLAEFYKYCEKLGKPKNLLPAALRSLPESFPCYVSTPSGGFHLYFKYRGPEIKNGKNLAPNVEIKHGSPGLTAPGSYKNGKPYILHGGLDHAPRLYPFIEDELPKHREPPPPKYTPPAKPGTDKKEFKTTLETIKQWTDEDGPYNGRNRYCYEFARRAARDKFHFTRAEVIAFLKSDPYTADHEQIESAVNSAFKDMSK